MGIFQSKYRLFFFFWQVKVQGQNEEMLLAACEQFLGKAEQEIRRVALETLGEIFYLMKLLLSNGDTHLIFKNNICVVFN